MFVQTAPSSIIASFVNFSLKGGGIEAKRLTGDVTIAPSSSTSSMVKSGDSRSFFFSLSLIFFSSSFFFFSFSSSFFLPGRSTSSSIGATESSRVEVCVKCQIAAAPAGSARA
jgi:hypothetical protein